MLAILHVHRTGLMAMVSKEPAQESVVDGTLHRA